MTTNDKATKAAHTPGPWYESVTAAHQGLVISETTGSNVAVAYDERDAALIAAAPAMLGALESLLRVADALISQSEHDIYCEEFSDARAAIAAARGGAK